MKIVFVETNVDGHHKLYLQELIKDKTDFTVILPQTCKDIPEDRQIIVKYDNKRLKFSVYRKWLKNVYKIIKEEKPDIVHFLYGDIFYRFFGFGLKKKYNTVITFHVLRRSFLRDLSLRRIFSKIEKGVVHTKTIYDELKGLKINNTVHIEYPSFNSTICYPKGSSRKFFALPENKKILAAVGGTRADKGLDLLLEALKDVKKPFHLLVAGDNVSFSEKYIEEHAAPFIEHVTIFMKYLTDEEYSMVIDACDIAVLPYRKIFNGASGPLTDFAAMKKAVIGPSHGSMGEIIEDNHIGITFESENLKELSLAIEKMLDGEFVFDEIAEKYIETLKVKNFKKKYDELYSDMLK